MRKSPSLPAAAALIALAALPLASLLALASCAAPMLAPVAPWAIRANADWASGAWIQSSTSAEAAQGGIAAVEFRPDGRCMVQYRQTGGSSGTPVTLDLEARVFELKGKLFADVTLPIEKLRELSSTYACFAVPTHVLARIDRQPDGSVVIAMASFESVAKLAKETKTTISARQFGDVEEVSVMTGDSEAITKFFEANAANDELFHLKMRFVRPK